MIIDKREVLKVTTLQIFAIFQKVRNGVYFLHADKHPKFLKIGIIVFDGNSKLGG